MGLLRFAISGTPALLSCRCDSQVFQSSSCQGECSNIWIWDYTRRHGLSELLRQRLSLLLGPNRCSLTTWCMYELLYSSRGWLASVPGSPCRELGGMGSWGRLGTRLLVDYLLDPLLVQLSEVWMQYSTWSCCIQTMIQCCVQLSNNLSSTVN